VVVRGCSVINNSSSSINPLLLARLNCALWCFGGAPSRSSRSAFTLGSPFTLVHVGAFRVFREVVTMCDKTASVSPNPT
jgi:hypothetical protein